VTAVNAKLTRIGVIGLGHVGRSVVDLFKPHAHVVAWDKADGIDYPDRELAECLYAIMCVGTPPHADGSADLTAVQDAIESLPCDRVLLKSTVPPGTSARLARQTGKRVCFWPEYIGESRYFNPFFPTRIDEVPFVILGGEPVDRRWFIDQLLPVLGPTKTYYQCAATEAELIKYAENSYFATKITFVNEFRRICEHFDVDWHAVREGWLLDPRVERMHTGAFQGSQGFAGRCLPKDLQAIIAAAAARGYDPRLLQEVLASNARMHHAVMAARLQDGEADETPLRRVSR
jgi:UDPglucose 6-dehydrogenase